MRKSTISANVLKALEQLEKNRPENAKRTLEGIASKLSSDAKAPKRKAGPYALYIKANYPNMAKQHPNLDSPEIFKKLGAEYRKTHDVKTPKKTAKKGKAASAA
jgi:hypothetical protein